MKKIIYTQPDGNVAVVHPAPAARLARETDVTFLERVAKRGVPAGVSYQIVEESVIPADRYFRNAWNAGQGVIDFDMAKCRTIHRNRLRKLRAPLLAALDVEYMKAFEISDTVAMQAIAVKKQALRDVTADPAISTAATPEDLKAVIPAALRAEV